MERKLNIIWAVVLGTVLLLTGCGGDGSGDTSDDTVLVLSSTSLRLEKGEASRIQATLTNGKNSKLLWSSDDESVATVANGLVTGVSAGETNISVQSEDAKYSALCHVTVVDPKSNEKNDVDYSKRILGADISMLSAYQDFGAVYKDADGKAVDVLPYFKEQGMTSMRVRLFVDPYNESTHEKAVIQDLKYVKNLARKIKACGMSFMLDFHYSDYWADPVKQYIPAEWKNLDTQGLIDKLYSYTKEVLDDLSSDGLSPDYIQIGNEVSYGMLWPNGKVSYSSSSNWDVFSEMLSSASKACRESAPEAKVIVHIERSESYSNCETFVKNMDKYGVDYDIFGLSYYPFWHGRIADFDKTLSSISAITSKDVMIVEYAYYNNWYPDDAKYTSREIGYGASSEGQRGATEELVEMLNSHPEVVGLYYWFPEENECPYTGLLESWTNRGLFDNNTGNALPALYELKTFIGNNTCNK